jgi:hypothetical protein
MKHTLPFTFTADRMEDLDMHSQKLEKSEKRAYVTPQLIVHGTVEEITALQNKTLGVSDGFLFEGAPIASIS